MKRTLTAIAAVLYLAACWAPQLWTGTADAQEKPKEPAVLEEVRARRFVLVDEEGRESAVLEVRYREAQLRLWDETSHSRSRFVATLSALGLTAKVEEPFDDETWQTLDTVRVCNSTELGPHMELQQRSATPRSLHATHVGAGEVMVGRADNQGPSTESMKRSARLSEIGVSVQADGTVRASMGEAKSVGDHSDTDSSREGAFVSYDADGNVLWMEPR